MEMNEDNWDIRTLRTYAKILEEQTFIKKGIGSRKIIQYNEAYDHLVNFLNEQPIHNYDYFKRIKSRLERILVPLIEVLIQKVELVPDAAWMPTFSEEANLYLSMYEQEHISYFQTQPILHNNYYEHGRLKDHYVLYNYEILFNPDSKLPNSMKEDIKKQIEHLRIKFV